MFVHSRACDPAVHDLCVKLAMKCTLIVTQLLRPEEIGECMREMYAAIRDELEKKPTREPEV